MSESYDTSQWDIDVVRAEQYRAFRQRRSKIIALSIVAAIVVVTSIVLHIRGNYLKHPLIGGFPPVENADGTIDYSVVDWRPPYQKYKDWQVTRLILRLPAAYQVSYPGNMGVKMSGPGVGFSTKANRFNYISLDARLPDFTSTDPVKIAPGHPGADKEILDLNIEGNVFPPDLFEVEVAQATKLCTQSSMQTEKPGNSALVALTCKYPLHFEGLEQFALLDNGRITAMLQCVKHKVGGSCSSRFSFFKRIAGLSFDMVLLSEYSEIQNSAIKFMSNKLLEEKTENVALIGFGDLIWGR
jgi:hypothetical protein